MPNLPHFLFETYQTPDMVAYGKYVKYTPAKSIGDWLLKETGEVRIAELVYSPHLTAYFYLCNDPQDRAVQAEFGLVTKSSSARY